MPVGLGEFLSRSEGDLSPVAASARRARKDRDLSVWVSKGRGASLCVIVSDKLLGYSAVCDRAVRLERRGIALSYDLPSRETSVVTVVLVGDDVETVALASGEQFEVRNNVAIVKTRVRPLHLVGSNGVTEIRL